MKQMYINILEAGRGGIAEATEFVGGGLRAFNERISDKVYNYIIEKTFENKLKQGQKITEAEIAKELQISTAPVREAMIRLDQEGWIRRYPNRGAYINNHVDKENCRNLYALRLCLEVGAFWRLTADANKKQIQQLEMILEQIEEGIQHKHVSSYRAADVVFHLAVAEFAGGKRLRDMLQPVLMQIFVIVFSNSDFIPKDESQTATHRDLLNAITSGDCNKSIRVITEHIYSQAKAHNIEI